MAAKDDTKNAQKDEDTTRTSEAFSSDDANVADAAGITEAEFKALRSNAGLNQLAGHEANVHAWEASPDGQAWLADEDKRQEQVKKENEEAEKASDEADEAMQAYNDAIDKGRKEAARRFKEDNRKAEKSGR